MVSDQMAGMHSYFAEVRVISDGAGQCRLLWRGSFEPLQGVNGEEVKRSLSELYSLMSRGLEMYVYNQAAGA